MKNKILWHCLPDEFEYADDKAIGTLENMDDVIDW